MSLVREMLGSARRSDIERWVRSHAHGVTMPSGDTLCRVLGEYMFVVTLDDFSIAPHLVLNGFWEMWVTMCLAKQRIPPGSRCIDVGANFGYYTVFLADLVGPTGIVEAWEPSKRLTGYLRQTLELNGLAERVHVVDAAAGAVAGDGILVREGHDYGSATMRDAVRVEGSVRHEPSAILPLSVTMLGNVDFLKIDAEGLEPQVWAGLGDLRPKQALVEWSPKRYAEPAAFLELLASQGYLIGRVDAQGDVVDVDTATLLAVPELEMLWLERRA